MFAYYAWLDRGNLVLRLSVTAFMVGVVGFVEVYSETFAVGVVAFFAASRLHYNFYRRNSVFRDQVHRSNPSK